jgi:hypothetical protein
MKPDWKVALEKQLKDQGVAPGSRTGRTATQKAKRVNMSDEQKAEVAAEQADYGRKRRPRRKSGPIGADLLQPGAPIGRPGGASPLSFRGTGSFLAPPALPLWGKCLFWRALLASPLGGPLGEASGIQLKCTISHTSTCLSSLRRYMHRGVQLDPWVAGFGDRSP